MDEAAERRIEQRLLATFGDTPPASAYDSCGLQTGGTFFKEPLTPSSPYTTLYLEQEDHGVERCEAEKDGDVEEGEGRATGKDKVTKKRKREEEEDEDDSGDEGEEEDEGQDEGQDGDEESGSSEDSSEQSEEECEALSFRKQVEQNLRYRRKRFRYLNGAPA